MGTNGTFESGDTKSLIFKNCRVIAPNIYVKCIMNAFCIMNKNYGYLVTRYFLHSRISKLKKIYKKLIFISKVKHI